MGTAACPDQSSLVWGRAQTHCPCGSAMDYSVTCGCGKTLAVAATQAGASVRCACGQTVDVPLLSALRRSAGEAPVPLSTVETIQAMIRRGGLPSGDICPFSLRPANATVWLDVRCESRWVRGGEPLDRGILLVWVVVLGWIGALIGSWRSEPREEFGRDTFLDIPLRISSDAVSKVARIRSQRIWRRLLRSVPVYARLLDEFPGTKIFFLRMG